MGLEQRVEALEEKMTTVQIKQAAQDVSNAHTAALLEKLSRAIDRFVESRLSTPPIEPILVELNQNLSCLNQKLDQPKSDDSKKNSFVLEFITENPKKFIAGLTATSTGLVWIVHHIAIISPI